ncbi:hypothetical protein MBLNU230_g7524t1 [Neophaeotheca triangularis]
MANQDPSAPHGHPPTDPYANWRESVLSTRSLSYLSTITDLPGFDRSRQGSLAQSHHPTRRNTLTSESDYDLEMPANEPKRKGSARDMSDIPVTRECSRFTSLHPTARDSRPYLQLLPHGRTGHQHLARLPTHDRLQPQLLRTCHIIYAEAARLLYTLNYFSFDHPSDANIFARALASPHHTSHITKLVLQLKAGDLRLWMPYITSADPVRSLKADFPRLKELWVRQRSSHWSQNTPMEVSLSTWDEDCKLNEIMDGLRHVYLTPPGEGHVGPVEELEEFERYVSRNPGVIRIDSEVDFKKQLLEFQKAKYAWKLKENPALVPPIVKVISVARISSAQDSVLTGVDPAAGQTQAPNQHAQAHDPFLHHAVPAATTLGSAQETYPRRNAPAPLQTPRPLPEGSRYRGFSAIDLVHGHKAVIEEDKGLTTRIYRTPFASKDGILLALEVYCFYGPRTRS